MNDALKSYIFYTELIMSGEPMECIYLLREACHAQPFITHEADFYKPTQDERKEYCLDLSRFNACPRLLQYQIFLANTGKR
jgi:hypothetical protein